MDKLLVPVEEGLLRVGGRRAAWRRPTHSRRTSTVKPMPQSHDVKPGGLANARISGEFSPNSLRI